MKTKKSHVWMKNLTTERLRRYFVWWWIWIFVWWNLFHQDEEVLDETDSDSSILVGWFCLFLAYWQMHFSITDTALEFLLKFITVFFGKIISLQPSSLLKRIHEKMPSSLYKFHQTLLIEKSHFKKYVVCIKCFALYDFE